MHSVRAIATIAHCYNWSSVPYSHMTLPTDTEDDQQEDNDNHRHSKAKYQAKNQRQLWTMVNVAHRAQFLNKVPQPNLQHIINHYSQSDAVLNITLQPNTYYYWHTNIP